MSTWRFQRRLTYILSVLFVIFAPIFLFWFLNTPDPTCFDKEHNQGEIALDCGGPCEAVCKEEVAGFQILWRRAFFLRPGEYDLAALIENPNNDFTAESFEYTFEVFDSSNKKIFEKSGTSYASPREQFIIFHPRVTLKDVEPSRIFFEIKNVAWKRAKGYIKPQLRVQDEKFLTSPRPNLSATIINELPKSFKNVETIATISSEENNVVAVSRTVIETLPTGGKQRVFFTWPEALPEPPKLCIRPIEAVLVFDRSGSMNDDNENPPQPLSDAKDAAKTFINKLSSRDKASLVSFGTEASFPIDQELTKDHGRVRDAISRISITPEEERGATNIGEGLERGIEELTLNGKGDGRQAIILLTDGKANAPGGLVSGELLAKEKARISRERGYDVYAIGLGSGVNKSFLQNDMASTPGKYYFAATTKELSGIYEDIIEDVCPERIYLTNIFVRSLDGSF